MKTRQPSILLLLLCLFPLLASAQWTQVGQDLNGSNQGDAFGRSVALNSAGDVLAVGNDRDSSSFASYVRMFAWDGNAWVQRGQDIEGTGGLDLVGEFVALSDAGDVVAIRARGVNNFAGATRVYLWDGTNWNQLGADMLGDSASAAGLCGDISMDARGLTVAVGACNINANAGRTKVYDWDGTAWVQRGQDLEGEAPGDRSGASISLNSGGNRIAIGAEVNQGGGMAAGHVRIYEWDGNNWVQMGSDIDGNPWEFFGSRVSMNDLGNVVAIGAPQTDSTTFDGVSRVYEWNGSSWVQRGQDIAAETTGWETAYSVSLNNLGNVLAVGASTNSGTAYWAGHVRVFSWTGSNWAQIGGDIDGVGEQDFFGAAVSLSATGTRIAVGASGNDENGTTSGEVRVFENPTMVGRSEPQRLEAYLYPNPAQGTIRLHTTSPARVKIYDTTGKLVFAEENMTDGLEITLHGSMSMYFAVIESSTGASTQKILIQ